jgi:pyruvate/2-oxoglutarate dehydrogenase complex dihydrolipoamide acyltransferase (E2) component
MNYEVLPFPPNRGLAVASLQVAVKRHIVHAIMDVDVTLPRQLLKKTSGADGRPFSFTSYVIACQAKALHANPTLQSYRVFNKLVVFHEVDVSTYVESHLGGMVTLHVVRNADTRSVKQISDELRAARVDPNPWGGKEKAVAILAHLPRFLQVLVFRLLAFNPHWLKRFYGTTQASSFGMLSKNAQWGIGILYGHTMGIWVGGVAKKPLVHEGSIAIRDCLHLSLSIDHDIVDAEPVAKFVNDFVGLLESGALLAGEASGA